MANIVEPPFLLDSARVVMYAETGGRASYTGKITIHANGKWLDPSELEAEREELRRLWRELPKLDSDPHAV